MAKRTKSDGGGAIGLIIGVIVLVGLILLAAVVFIPVILILAALFTLTAQRPSAPTTEARRTLQVLHEELWALNKRRDDLTEQGDSAGITRNVGDGLYSRRSKLGKRISAELEEVLPRISELESETKRRREAPYLEYVSWARRKSLNSALILTIVSYPVLFTIYFFVISDVAPTLSSWVSHNLLVSIQGLRDEIYGAAFAAGLTSVVALLALYPIRHASLQVRHRNLERELLTYASDRQEPRQASMGPWGERMREQRESRSENEREQGGRKGAQQGGEQSRDLSDRLDEKPWFAILDVSPTASIDEINASYRIRIAKNHPDLVAKLDPAIQELAAARSKELNRARDEGLRARS